MDGIVIHKTSNIIQKRKCFMSKKDRDGKISKGRNIAGVTSTGVKSTNSAEKVPTEPIHPEKPPVAQLPTGEGLQVSAANEFSVKGKADKFMHDLAKTAIIASVTSIIGLLVQTAVINEKLSSINENLAEINKEIGTLQKDVSSLSGRMLRVEDRLGITYIETQEVLPYESLTNSSKSMATDVPVRLSGNAIDVSSDTYVAENPETGDQLTMEDLVSKPIAFSYTDSETGDLVFFKGQYDENGYWTGNCIVNKYNDNKLVMIMDAEYDAGNLISYKMVQAIMNEKRNDDGSITEEPIWSVSEREVQGGANVGKTLTYFRDDSYEMKFDSNSFSGEDIISKDDFCNEMLDKLKLEGYYNGSTSNGLFNDTSGNACMVKYTRDGYIRTFYVGNVVKGDFNDSTGSAIEIVFDEAFPEKGYFYYAGNFVDGNKTDGITPYYIKQERIDEIVSQYDFDFEKAWRSVELDDN